MIDPFIQAILIVMLGLIAFALGMICEVLKDINRTLQDEEQDDEQNV